MTAAEALDHPREINGVLALLDSTWLDPRIHARPTHYDVAVSVVCNIKCPFCPRQTDKNEVVSGFLKPAEFEPILPHLETSVRTGLYGLGEPFLNKSFFEFLEQAKARGTYCMTSSHGMSLKPEIIERVLDSGLDELCVSMDGATGRTFNFLRAGADFRTVVQNVTAFLRRRRERGQTTPRVHIACAVSKYNVWQMARLVRLAHRMGADRIAFSNLIFNHEALSHASIIGTKIFDWNLARARREGAKLGIETLYFYQYPYPFHEPPAPPVQDGVRYGCNSAWRSLIVERDGNLKPCCYMNMTIGNTAKAPLSEQFNSGEAIELRRTFTERNFRRECKGCGSFWAITRERTAEILDEARARIENGPFSEATREQLRHVHAHFAELAERERRN
ncbi:radical SAM protein [Candidatus Poribacteria bacterium]|nr:radical SAM protein [Candidatus Poribacteria bacterium]